MPLDHYVTLGRSGLRVSPFCLGAMIFGEDLGWGSSVAESQAIMDRYTPTLNFPAQFLVYAATIQNGGATVNGERSEPSPWGVSQKGDHY